MSNNQVDNYAEVIAEEWGNSREIRYRSSGWSKGFDSFAYRKPEENKSLLCVEASRLVCR